MGVLSLTNRAEKITHLNREQPEPPPKKAVHRRRRLDFEPPPFQLAKGIPKPAQGKSCRQHSPHEDAPLRRNVA